MAVDEQTAWAVIDTKSGGNLLARTADSGVTWGDVTPPGIREVGDAFVLDARTAWVGEMDATGDVNGHRLFETVNGGRSWGLTTLAAPDGCGVDFIDRQRGWCTLAPGYAGSEPVELYRTVDGGGSWQLVSASPQTAHPTPDALPFGCDKSGPRFVSPTVGWVGSFCNGGGAFLYVSRDAGQSWFERTVQRPPSLGG
jgi:photosystem II stability/assembly factor-like uncharacterized protein